LQRIRPEVSREFAVELRCEFTVERKILRRDQLIIRAHVDAIKTRRHDPVGRPHGREFPGAPPTSRIRSSQTRSSCTCGRSNSSTRITAFVLSTFTQRRCYFAAPSLPRPPAFDDVRPARKRFRSNPRDTGSITHTPSSRPPLLLRVGHRHDDRVRIVQTAHDERPFQRSGESRPRFASAFRYTVPIRLACGHVGEIKSFKKTCFGSCGSAKTADPKFLFSGFDQDRVGRLQTHLILVRLGKPRSTMPTLSLAAANSAPLAWM